MAKPLIHVIIGTTRPSRISPQIAAWYMKLTKERPDMDFELIDLAEVNLPMYNEPQSPKTNIYEFDYTKNWSEKIARADGYVWITGEYNHGVPPSLSNAITYLYHEWNRKPVAFVGYGGLGAARAVEHLVSVSNELDMVPVRTRLSIINAWDALDDNGNVKSENLIGSPADHFDQLAWWVSATKIARESSAILAKTLSAKPLAAKTKELKKHELAASSRK